MKSITKLTLALASVFLLQGLMAEETLSEKAGTTVDKAVDGVKKGYRNIKDATCMKGDLECAAQEAKHGIQNTADSAKTKAKELKNKAD